MRTLKTLKWWAVPAATLVIAIGVAAGPTEATKRAVVPAPVAATVLTEDPTCALPKVPTTTAPTGAVADAGDHTATVRDLPLREQIDVPVREQLIVELYSK